MPLTRHCVRDSRRTGDDYASLLDSSSWSEAAANQVVVTEMVWSDEAALPTSKNTRATSNWKEMAITPPRRSKLENWPWSAPSSSMRPFAAAINEPQGFFSSSWITYLPRPRSGVESCQCRARQPRPDEGDVGHRALPHRGARRACGALRGLCPHGHRLQQLPQPALSQVPGHRRQGMARRARGWVEKTNAVRRIVRVLDPSLAE